MSDERRVAEGAAISARARGDADAERAALDVLIRLDAECCPSCGNDPADDSLHRDGCERIDTCGQFGPPWLDRPWHPVGWDIKTQAQHRRDAHSA